MVAERLGIPAGVRQVSNYSGAAPQKLIAQACRAILAGETDAMLVVGGIADASVRRARDLGIAPPAPPTSHWSQGSAHSPDLPRRMAGAFTEYTPEVAAGALMPSSYFALVESAFAAGRPAAEHRAELGRMLSPFTEVASRRPELAWFPTPRTAEEISTPSPGNRLIAEPFTKLMCSFPTVDLAAALVVAIDESSGRPVVRPLGLVSASEAVAPSGWHTIGRPESLHRAVAELLRLTEVATADIDQFDFYSCFPTAVRVASNAFGLAGDDPRPRTASGGLPYLGGPGASYSIHGIACLVEDLRARPGTLGAAASLGGMVSYFSVGLYGAVDEDAGGCRLSDLPIDSSEVVPTVKAATGPATIDAATVLHDKGGPAAAPIIARLPDGSRTGARAGDPELPAALAEQPSPVGREVILTPTDAGLVYTLK